MIGTSASSVLVIGAGPSGLVALKELREANIEAMAIEQRSDFGGVFAPSSGVTYEKLHLTTSNMFMEFSDFPPLDSKMKYWSQCEYYDYLDSYVHHFALRPHIHFNTTMEHAKLDVNGKWRVKLLANGGKQGRNNETVLMTFDYLVVATGPTIFPTYLPSLKDSKEKSCIPKTTIHHNKSK